MHKYIHRHLYIFIDILIDWRYKIYGLRGIDIGIDIDIEIGICVSVLTFTLKFKQKERVFVQLICVFCLPVLFNLRAFLGMELFGSDQFGVFFINRQTDIQTGRQENT